MTRDRILAAECSLAGEPTARCTAASAPKSIAASAADALLRPDCANLIKHRCLCRRCFCRGVPHNAISFGPPRRETLNRTISRGRAVPLRGSVTGLNIVRFFKSVVRLLSLTASCLFVLRMRPAI